jgi:hypothetical protein
MMESYDERSRNSIAIRQNHRLDGLWDCTDFNFS